jgi:hypothetical protein
MAEGRTPESAQAASAAIKKPSYFKCLAYTVSASARASVPAVSAKEDEASSESVTRNT